MRATLNWGSVPCALKADIDKSLTDVAAGHMNDFDADAIIARGRKLWRQPLHLRITETAEAELARRVDVSQLTISRFDSSV